MCPWSTCKILAELCIVYLIIIFFYTSDKKKLMGFKEKLTSYWLFTFSRGMEVKIWIPLDYDRIYFQKGVSIYFTALQLINDCIIQSVNCIFWSGKCDFITWKCGIKIVSNFLLHELCFCRWFPRYSQSSCDVHV